MYVFFPARNFVKGCLSIYFLQCSFDMQTCPNAERGCKEKVQRNQLQQHRNECVYELLSCPNMNPLCKPFLRKDISIHEKECCSYPCQYAFEGCPFIGTALQAKQHCDVYCGRLHKRIEELEAECQRLKSMIPGANDGNTARGTVADNTHNGQKSQDFNGQSDPITDLDLLQQMFNGDTFLPIGLPNKAEDAQMDNKSSLGELMDIGDCLQKTPGLDASSQASQPPKTTTATSTFNIGFNFPQSFSSNQPTVTPVPVTAPKRAPNGRIIRYSRNAGLAQSALRMARELQQQTNPLINNHTNNNNNTNNTNNSSSNDNTGNDQRPFESIMEDLDVAGKHAANAMSPSGDLANLLAQNSLSSPQSNPYTFSFDDIQKFLSESPKPRFASPASPARQANKTPAASPARNSNNSAVNASKKNQQRIRQVADSKSLSDKESRAETSSARSPQPTPHSPASPSSSSAARKPQMFVLASSYLSNYNNNKS